ncbi:beta-lactamase/transpeptidase-like protein [Crassisporium funariophilum]|nr:beta-lactamase/transpeptidase-like protein [Crassisporium funariophilum]
MSKSPAKDELNGDKAHISVVPKLKVQQLKGVISLVTWVVCLCLAAKVAYTDFATGSSSFWSLKSSASVLSSRNACKPPSPNLLAYHPPRADEKLILKAAHHLDRFLAKRTSHTDIDSVSVAVITPDGPIYERGYGVLRANESDGRVVDRDSIYRIASITKMFTVLETLILRERGALNWDDPVEKYLPEFSPPSYGWAEYLNGDEQSNHNETPRITLRQLASHLAGIGRDYPPADLGEWPDNDPLEVPRQAGIPGRPERSYTSIIKALSQYPLINIPYEYPIYSNTGIDLLGLSNIAANKLQSSDPAGEPGTHKELLLRDVFEPLGLNSSFYRVPESGLKAHIAVPKIDSEWANFVLGDTDDPAGGQYSSLADLGALMKTFLSPTAKGGVVPARVIREWLRPLYVWDSNVPQQVGAPWEILNIGGVQAYTKGGNLPGYHSEFALVPGYSYGIIVLMTGTYADTTSILAEAANHFQPAFEAITRQQLRKAYGGIWINGHDVAEVGLVNGGLYLKQLVVRGVDVLGYVQSQDMGLVKRRKGVPVALWSTGRTGEFRLAFGRPELNNVPGMGCEPYWITIDPGLDSRGAPIDLIYWHDGVLTYPSAGVSFARKRRH